MKLNFWQWLGIIVFVIALIFIIRDKMGGGETVTPNQSTTQPAT